MAQIKIKKLNFRRPQSRKLFSGRFINAVHLAHAPTIAEQNDMQRALYPLSVLAAPSTDRQTLIFFLFFLKKKRRKQVFRCTWKVVVQVTLLTFVIFLFMYDDDINEKQTTEHRLWKYVARKKSLSLHYLIICSCYQRIGSAFASKVSLPKRCAKATPIWHMEPGRFQSRR